MRLYLAVATAWFVSTLPASLPAAPPVGASRGAAATYCARTERTLWWCLTARRWYALCASADLEAATGYLQYRAGRGDVRELVFPAERRHPRGMFTLSLAPRGVVLSFTNREVTYAIAEPLTGATVIDVTRADRSIATITCRSASETLTLTDTMAFFRTIGVYR